MKQNRKVHAKALPHFSFYNNRIWCSGTYTVSDNDGKIPGYFYTPSLCFIWSCLANASLLSVVNTAAAGCAPLCAFVPVTGCVARAGLGSASTDPPCQLGHADNTADELLASWGVRVETPAAEKGPLCLFAEPCRPTAFHVSSPSSL